MNEFIFLMGKPLLACLILAGIHAYLGLHIIERGVIFVDLALAQIAALGATVAIFLGFDLHDQAAYWFSLAATFIGAVIFSLTRSRKERIPQEAIVGIVYIVAAAAAFLVVSRTAQGDEHVRTILVGNILLVERGEIIKILTLYSLVGLFHWKFRKTFLLISTHPAEAYRQNLGVRGWDLAFYLSFGLVVTSSVQIAGVLLVFSFLIIPAVCAMLFARTLGRRLVLGWIFGVAGSFLGILFSYLFDLPTGATTVCAFGGMLALLSLRGLFRRGQV